MPEIKFQKFIEFDENKNKNKLNPNSAYHHDVDDDDGGDDGVVEFDYIDDDVVDRCPTVVYTNL